MIFLGFLNAEPTTLRCAVAGRPVALAHQKYIVLNGIVIRLPDPADKNTPSEILFIKYVGMGLSLHLQLLMVFPVPCHFHWDIPYPAPGPCWLRGSDATVSVQPQPMLGQCGHGSSLHRGLRQLLASCHSARKHVEPALTSFAELPGPTSVAVNPHDKGHAMSHRMCTANNMKHP